jgi:uncharacterized protein
MTRLQRKKTLQTLVPNLEIARSFVARAVGLLGRRDLAEDHGLWILRCGTIHTFFMRFSIDLIFLNHDLVVKGVYQNVRPWRVVWPVWGASSVVELRAGFLEKNPVLVGEELHVDHPLS